MITKENLNTVVEINKKIHDEINRIVRQDKKKYYDENINIIQKVMFEIEQRCTVFKYPLNIDKLGGYYCKLTNSEVCFVNTNQTRAFQNFVILHEFYHLNHDCIENNSMELITLDEEERLNLNERKANYYASLMLMDETSVIEKYNQLFRNKKLLFEEIICYLIYFYKAPKKLILIRLHEVGCIDFEQVYENFNNDLDKQKEIFQKLALDSSILETSNVISFGDVFQEFDKASQNNVMLESFLIQNKKYLDEKIKDLEKYKTNDR